MGTKMKLYVWNDVLTDYTSGIMFAVARSVEEARATILANGGDGLYSVEHDLQIEPKVYDLDKPYGQFIYGGG